MIPGLPGTKVPAQQHPGRCWVGRRKPPPLQMHNAALSAALTLCDCKLFSFDMELGIWMEGTDSSIFQKFIVPD